MSKKIMIVCPISRDICTFRTGLIKQYQNNGYNVYAIAFDSIYAKEINDLGVELFVIPDNNRGLNPFKILTLRNKYEKIIKQVKPDIVFTFMLKPNLFCTRAAKKAKVENIFAMVEGGGDVFGNKGLKWNIVRFVACKFYKKAFKCTKKVFFINYDDRKEFLKRNLLKEDKCENIPGVGVDLEKFQFSEMTSSSTFLMVSRMLKTKGVFEYCEAARKVKAVYPNAVFNYIGEEGDVKVDDIRPYINDGTVNYLGVTKDVRKYYANCSVQVLPSYYREGLVLVNIEAGAMGRPSITCNNIGTKDTVIDGYNGFLIPVKDVDALANKMIFFLDNPEKTVEMGINNRKLAEEKFDQRKINQKVFKVVAENLS